MKIAAPQLAKYLEELQNLRELMLRDETITSALLRNEDISGITVKSFNASELRFEKLDATKASLEKTSFSDVELHGCNLIATAMPEASWRRISVTNSRCSGLQIYNSTLKDILLTGCKLDLANFRFSKLKNVVFKDCQLDEAEFYAAELENVSFQNCNFDKTQFSDAKLKNVDLRTSEITGIKGIGSLRGAIIDSTQLMQLAPYLANEFRIIIKDD